MLNHEKGAPPLYSQLEAIIKRKIEQGEYEKGDFLPTEKMFMDQYQVSRVTVRQAMAALSQAGYIKCSRGIGTEVIFEKIDEHLKSVISFTDEMKQHNITMETTYCQMEKIYPNAPVAQALNIRPTDQCYCLTRVRCVHGSPLVYTVTYLKDIAELPMDSQYYMESLYQYLNEVHGIRIARGRDTLEAALPSPIVCKYLEIDEHMPVFKRVRQTFLSQAESSSFEAGGKDGAVFEYSICYYPGNRYKYTVDL